MKRTSKIVLGAAVNVILTMGLILMVAPAGHAQEDPPVSCCRTGTDIPGFCCDNSDPVCGCSQNEGECNSQWDCRWLPF